MRIVLLGPPGVGKGTVGALLEDALHLPHLSSGNLVRAEISKGTEWGKHAIDLINKGYLIPDIEIVDMVKRELEHDKYKDGVILDAFPRTIKQAQILDEQNLAPDYVISIEVPESELIRRLSARRMCKECKAVFNNLTNPSKVPDVCDRCQGPLILRKDDTPEVIKNRLEVYREKTQDLIDFYKGRDAFKTIDGTGTPQEVADLALDQIK